MSRKYRVALAAIITATAGAAPPTAARADHIQQSLFQDDQYLIDSSPAVAAQTLALLKSIGVQRVRVTVEWSHVAPAATSTTRPPGFDATNPAAYPAGAWQRYDDLLALAIRYGIGVEFNITAPGPLWAMTSGAPTWRAANHWAPSASEFGQFVYAVGRRFSGAYENLPRVGDWSIWNEPNQPGWLAPQWQHDGPGTVAESARLYRAYVEAGFVALRNSGHSPKRDTILIGELAPEGVSSHGDYTAMTPMPFLRALYCVGRSYGPLRGNGAAALGCPAIGAPKAFASANPGLFDATGFAHHPYDFFRSPTFRFKDPNFVPLANIARLEHGLDRAFRAYRVTRRIPLYITEYGYQTNPPDPYQVVTPAKQAVYLNEADYLAWRNARVRTVSQFLLFDSPPDSDYAPSDFNYWDTFQTGLLFADGRPKPAFDAYRIPIWIPTRHAHRGARIFVWGQLRAAPHDTPQRALIQWRGRRHGFHTIAAVITHNPSGYLTARVRLPGAGAIRIAWRSGAGGLLVSRSVAVSAR